MDRAEQDHEATHTDLKLAFRRIAELQAALQEDDEDELSLRHDDYFSDLDEDENDSLMETEGLEEEKTAEASALGDI